MSPQPQIEQSEEEMEIRMVKAISAAAKIPMKAPFKTPEEQKEVDSRSVHMGNVDWNSTVQEVEEFFKGCGAIRRVTIPKDKFTGRQKNFAYIEFDSTSSAALALTMNQAVFRGRAVSVVPKRTNTPHWQRKDGAPRAPQRGAKVVYVYVNGPKPAASRRFAPY